MSNALDLRARLLRSASKVLVIVVIIAMFLGVPLAVAAFSGPLITAPGDVGTAVRLLVIGMLVLGSLGGLMVLRELKHEPER